MEDDDLAIDILDHDDELLGTAVDFLVPSEVGSDRQVDAKQGSRNGLHLGLQMKLGEVVNKSMNELASILNVDADELAKTGRSEVEVAIAWELLSLSFADNLGRYTLELEERRHGTPHPLLGHLSKVESCASRNSPFVLEADLVHCTCTQNTTRRLLDKDREPIKFELRDVRL